MEQALQKFLRKMISEKYPVVLDVHVNELGRFHPNKKKCYEVFLIIFEDDWNNMGDRFGIEVEEYIENLSKYMNVSICGVFNEKVNEKEWEEMKKDNKD